MSVLSDLQTEVQTKTQRVQEVQTTVATLEQELEALRQQLQEPWETRCPGCDALLTITPPTGPVPQVLTPLYCPICQAEVWQATTEGYTISSGIVGEEPWYKKYAPHLIVGGGLAAALIYFTRKK